MRFINANDFDCESKPTYPILERPPGKIIGGNIYIHRQYALGYLPEHHCWKLRFVFKVASEHPNYDPNWNVLKVNNSSMSFISCPTFDKEPEPVVGNSLHVPFLVESRKVDDKLVIDDMVVLSDCISVHVGGKQVYHHKWMMVGDDYKGFNVQKSINRSLWWEARYHGSRSGIGSLKVWKAILEKIS